MRNRAIDLLPIATVNRTRAEVVLSSITPYGPETRLDSIYAIFPKMVMVERNRHRGMSLSDRSSRAVPPEKLIEEIRSGVGLAMPAKFKERAKGMGGGDEFTGDKLLRAQVGWIDDALEAADRAERAMQWGEAKETVNRRLDPYIYAHTLMSATRDIWMNFLGLRLDIMADPTIQVLAEKCIAEYKRATPKVLQPGEWHLPFVDVHDEVQSVEGKWDHVPDILRKVSAARSAHLSYNELETGQRMTFEKALSICDKLEKSRPLHASPFEHQATPDELVGSRTTLDGIVIPRWRRPNEHGNFFGWRQARKMIPGEAVAPLPEGWYV